MGQYKSILTAERATRDLPYTVDIPVPGSGLGKNMDTIADWLNTHAKGRWASHGLTVERSHVSRHYFESPWDAKRFEDWVTEQGLLSEVSK